MSKYKRYERYKDSGVEWIGEIPEHWEIGRLKNSIKSCRNGIWGDEPQGDINDVACIRVVDFNRTNMEIEVNNLTIRNVPVSKQKMYLLKRGDLLIEKSGGGEKQPVGFVTIFNHDIPAVYANFIARMELEEEKVYSGFYKYVHYAMYSVRLNVKSIKQTTGIQNLDINYYFEESVIYPPLNEQKIIANFLDQKTAEIDSLIADKEKLIELLQEKRQAIITEAVTKGLNPNVKMKDSGVEWIGEIPEHWEINKLKRLSNIITGNTPPKSEEENYDDEGIPWVKPDNIQDDGTISETKERLSVIGLQKARLIPKSSAIVCCIGTVGKVGFTQEDCTTNQQINSIIFERPSIWNNKYGFYCLCSSKNEHEKYSNKVVVSILNKTQQGNILMPVPSLKEQKAIANFLDQKTAEIDDLITEIKLQIQKLKEYRQSLISEAVTGKIDVREFQNKNEVIFRNE
ncbi:hypothetical protein CSTERLE_08665 [Thermoclostridium stercorarium subsp. leptospartum DSM 9219]|uniref:Type I restriction modification DNA specificity domain-containing protein n=1 Tax=Thermoclostridium stercorarium subsp. leptospartum DSM 9219 TaxID=1346611 RepID=A0A1B1YLM6_THEST|nr:restriction endonuclease subunit S [Thermoclostridium stercorarium]ANX01643.1 hypothetical protein CSTERLE_08665 [Thermoclostridium stercorarium subsp. leptospartum DSM 9219]